MTNYIYHFTGSSLDAALPLNLDSTASANAFIVVALKVLFWLSDNYIGWTMVP